MMKKTMTLTTIMLLSVMSMSAQSLIGTWKSSMPDEHGLTMQFGFTFFPNSDFILRISDDLVDPSIGSWTIAIYVNGTYAQKEDKLHLKFNSNSTLVQMENEVWNDEVLKTFNSRPHAKEAFYEMMGESLQTTKDEFMKLLPFGEMMNIKTLTERQLQVYSEDEKKVFTFVRNGR